MLNKLIKDLEKVRDPIKAKRLAVYFKSKKGEYGEGDIFLGIIVPKQRSLSKKYSNLSLSDIQKLLSSKNHEYRMTALFILISKYEKAEDKLKGRIINLYLKNLKKGRVNNWDLVDLSAPKILGDYLFARDKMLLYTLVRSKNLWQRRIAVLSTFDFIKKGRFKDSLKIAKILISDKEDLIHKAVGWMLREIGKRNLETEINFLNKFYKKMPRVTLRYATERFTKESRNKYLLK